MAWTKTNSGYLKNEHGFTIVRVSRRLFGVLCPLDVPQYERLAAGPYSTLEAVQADAARLVNEFCLVGA